MAWAGIAAQFAQFAKPAQEGVQGIFTGGATQRAYNRSAREAQNNAGAIIDQAARAEGQVRRDREVIAGSQIATAGASGVTLDGSPTSVIVDSAVNSELAALNERYRGSVEALPYINQAAAYRQQSKAIGVSKWARLIDPGLYMAFETLTGVGKGVDASALGSLVGSKLAGTRAITEPRMTATR